jgi:transposase
MAQDDKEHSMASQASSLLPDPTCLYLSHVESSGNAILMVVRTIADQACCPLCQTLSQHIHSHYTRRVADLPWMGWAVKLELHTRRFFCLNLACSRQIFAERLPSVVAPYARRTTRLADILILVAFALGGEAGKRLAGEMGLATSPDTLLRLIQTAPEKGHPTPQILGVETRAYLWHHSPGS